MRYAHFPAVSESKGLIVVFHGYLGFEIYPVRYGWQNFDLLLPLDNFGWKGLGSWFWGEKGSNFVEEAAAGLIEKVLADLGTKRWFSIGASMGGFAAMYHGIKYTADGIYVMTLIIDLKAKIRNYQPRNIQTSYTELLEPGDEELKKVPDIYREAKQAETLPPLSKINTTAQIHLVRIHCLCCKFTAKRRPGTDYASSRLLGHQGHDGSYDEAQYFFDLIQPSHLRGELVFINKMRVSR